MRKVQFGIIGCGMIAKVHAAALQGLSNAQLRSVCDPTPATAENFARANDCLWFTDLKEMLSDPQLDAVCLCTPPKLHLPLGRQVAQAGKHLVMEKPLSADVQEAKALVDICREQGVILCGILQHRFDPLVVAVRKLLQDGVFGKVRMADARILWYRDDDYYTKVPWHAKKENGGVMLNQAIHYMDLLGYLTGGVKAVSGVCRTLGHDIEPEDCAVAALEFHCGAVGTLEASTVCYPGVFAELNLFAEEGYITIRDESLAGYSHRDGSIEALDAFLGQTQLSASARPDDLEADSHRAELQDFCQAVLTGTAPAVTGEESIQVLRLIDAVTRSSEADGARILI